MTPCIIDIEASGFGRGSYPIEVGVVLPDGVTHCFLITPAPDWTHWDPTAEAIHHISRQTLQAHGRPVLEVAQELNRLLVNEQVYSDAWGHDLSWLGKLFDEADLPQRFTLDSVRNLITEEQAALWHPTKERVAMELDLARHRASTDALVLQETYRRVVALALRTATPSSADLLLTGRFATG